MKFQSLYKVGDYIRDRYLVHTVLIGGMGEVYQVTDIALDEIVAIKTYISKFLSHPKLVEAFISEARTWVMLEKHPNIVQAKSIFWSEEKPFVVMEWIHGDEKLGSCIRNLLRYGALEISLALDLAIQFCYGAAYAYRKLGLVHRDIKPDNILIANDRTLKITDFGLAHVDSDIQKIRNRDKSKTRDIVGTPPYMAPEQWLGMDATLQSDIYSFGVTLFELTTGQLPFQAFDIDAYRRLHQVHTPLNPQKINPKIPNELSVIILKCLEKNPIKRFLYYEDLIEHLKNVYHSYIGNLYSPKGEDEKDKVSEAQILNNGDSLFVLGRYSEAKNYYDQLIDLNPKSAIFWQRKAECLIRLGKLDQALLYFNEAIRLEPSNLESVRGKTKCLIDLGQEEAALECCSPTLALNPNDIELLKLKQKLLTKAPNIEQEQPSQSKDQSPITSEFKITVTDITGTVPPPSPLNGALNLNDAIFNWQSAIDNPVQSLYDSRVLKERIPHLDDLDTECQELFDQLFLALANRLQDTGIVLEISAPAKKFICELCNLNMSGEKIFEDLLEVPLIDKLLEDELKAGDCVKIENKFDEIIFERME